LSVEILPGWKQERAVTAHRHAAMGSTIDLLR